MILDCLEEPDVETLTNLLNSSQQTRRRRALCANIGIDPNELDFIENTSEKDFCILLINLLNRTNNKTALCHLCCKELTPIFFKNNKLEEIIVKLECDISNTIIERSFLLNKRKIFIGFSATFGVFFILLIAGVFGVNNNSICASSNHKLSQVLLSATVKFVSPFNGECVSSYQQVVQGEVTVQEAKKVWIVVKPEPNSVYYVQAPTDIINGQFTTGIYLGDKDTAPATKFTIRAFVEPYNQLKEGDKLSDWPKAKWSSDPVTVTRNR